jgi:RimJ/RimL family protein N-acetyltransferase
MSFAMLEARVESVSRLEGLLGCAVPESFPLSDTLKLFHSALRMSVPDKHSAGDWGSYLLIHESVVIGLAGFKGPPLDGAVEVFYELVPEARGRGLATEAVQALCDWAQANGATRVIAKIEPDNIFSRRVLERCGFQRTEQADERHLWFALV